MKKWKIISGILSGWLMLSAFGSVGRAAGTIAGAEYFIDNDPGVGIAIALDAQDGVWDSNSETATKAVDTSGLSVGPHVLGIRFRKSDGTWSYTRKMWFTVAGQPVLTGAEWYVDTDPGKGKGNPISLPADGVWDEADEKVRLENVSVSQLSKGMHTAFVRFRDGDGNWGSTRRATFEVRPELYIAAAEWTTDANSEGGTGNMMYALDSEFDQANEEIISDEIDAKTYDCIYVRVQDNLGRWSSRLGLRLDETGAWVFDPILAWNRENMLMLKGFPCMYSTYAGWVALGRPGCWGIPPFGSGYQCDGDADGKDSGGLTKFRVFTGDLKLIVDNWRKKAGDPTLNACADLDHKDSGMPSKFRVFIGDLRIVVENWQKRDSQLPGNCPRPE